VGGARVCSLLEAWKAASAGAETETEAEAEPKPVDALRRLGHRCVDREQEVALRLDLGH
jgi:hypothetical protein